MSKLRYAGLMFVDSGVEVSGAFYRNVPQCATKRAVRLSYTSDLSVFRLLAGECQGALPYARLSNVLARNLPNGKLLFTIQR